MVFLFGTLHHAAFYSNRRSVSRWVCLKSDNKRLMENIDSKRDKK